MLSQLTGVQRDEDAGPGFELHLEDRARRYPMNGAVHENLRRFRKTRRLQQKEIAALMEVTSRTYRDYEKGIRPVPSDALVRLAVLTGGDLNEILLGRPAETRPETVEGALNDYYVILRFLSVEYPDMDLVTSADIARFALIHDWQGMPRVHPEVIRDAVRMKTRYRFHPEDIPAPPFWEDYGDDQDLFEEHTAEWQRQVDEDRGAHPEDAEGDDDAPDKGV
jgi:transcriptional regulator with XRE-family HTH domain